MTDIEYVQQFFEKYIFGFMCNDIERELDLAKSGQLSGNFLCALGLLNYTEVMGSVMEGKFQKGTSKDMFNAFFDYIGSDYKVFNRLNDEGENVYSVFRCGLAHEYFVKRDCSIIMLNSDNNIEVPPHLENITSFYIASELISVPTTCGIGKLERGHYYFIVEQYYIDFRRACERLLTEFENGLKDDVLITLRPFMQKRLFY